MTRLHALLVTLALAVVLGPSGSAAAPPDTSDHPTPEAVVQTELRRSLASDSVALQRRAMRRINAYAHTHRYDAALLHDLVRPLHRVVAEGQTEPVRLMAISALAAIGTDTAMLGLQVEKDDLESARLRDATEAILAAYAADQVSGPQQSRLDE